jgi:hypothetical protein
MTAGRERPREEWMEIPLPALVSEDSSARAQELLERSKIRSRRRSIEPSIVQGLISCQKCGYAFAWTGVYTAELAAPILEIADDCGRRPCSAGVRNSRRVAVLPHCDRS